MKKSALGISKKEKDFLLRFFASFFVLYGLLIAIDRLTPSSFQPFKTFVAFSSAAILRLAGLPSAAIAQSSLFFQNGAYSIVVECTGLVLLILLFSLLFASRLPRKQIALYLCLYAPFLFAFNAVRVAFTIAVGVLYGPATMGTVHVSLWLVDSLLVLLLWMRAAGIRISGPKAKAASRRL